MALTMPFDPTSSMQATRLAWAIERYAAGELTAEQIEATHEFDPGYDVTNHLRRFRIFRRPIDEVFSYEPGPVLLRAEVRSGEDLAQVSVRLGDAPEYRILAMALMKKPAAGVTTREATEDDGPALRDLERRCAVETGGVSVYYDRGDDYFAQQRLMAQQLTSVAEHEGRIVGVMSDAIHRIRVAGTEYRTTYRFHIRVDPDARSLGVFPALNTSNYPFFFAERPLAISSSFMAAQNAQMTATRGSEQMAGAWTTQIERIVLSCHDVAETIIGRPAVAADAARIAELLAQSHGTEELALDFDAASIRDRLNRSPRDYSWPNVNLSGRAVLGIWDSGLRIVRADTAGTIASRTATALDWGFEPGAEDEMEALLRSACATLAAAGVDDLVIFSSPPSRGRDLAAGLARAVEPFIVTTQGVKPRTAETQGVYVDPIYF